MMRGYSYPHYLNLIEKAKDLMPGLTLTTDIIVGFPGETDRDFQDTIKAVKDIRFDFAYMFAYSKRNGTLASLLPDQVKDIVKKERLRLLINAQNKITKEKAEELIGNEERVLTINKAKDGKKLGKTKNGKLVVIPGVAKIGFEYIINIYKIKGWVPVGKIKKEVVG